MRIFMAGLAIGSMLTISSFAQSVISAHSGVIHYTEGKVLVDNKVVEPKSGQFPDLAQKSVLTTEEGRAEVLLTPGVFLRVGENSSVRMLSNHLSDTRLELLSGEALVECDELLKDNEVAIVYKDSTVQLAKHGLYRFDATPGRLRVYDGEAIVKNPSGQLTAKKGHEVMLNGGALMASKFDVKEGDELMRWAQRRSGYLSMANVAAARSAGSYGYSGLTGGGGWVFNPWFGMYTFVPYGMGLMYSPFGFPFWSPYAAFMYAPYWGGYYGYYPYYGGYYGGGGGGTSAVAFHPTPRGTSASRPYSASGAARGPAGGFGRGGFGRGNSGGFSGPGYSGGGLGRGGNSGGGLGGGSAVAVGGGGGMAGGGARGGGGGPAGGGHR